MRPCSPLLMLLLLTSTPGAAPAQILPAPVVTLAAPSTALLGSSGALTASFTPPNATGRVAFYDGATWLGTTAISGSTAGLTTPLLAAGSHRLAAFYLGDASYSRAWSNPITTIITAFPAATFG